MEPTESDLLTIKEAAVRANLSAGTLYNWISAGRLRDEHGLCHAGRKVLIDWPIFYENFLRGQKS